MKLITALYKMQLLNFYARLLIMNPNVLLVYCLLSKDSQFLIQANWFGFDKIKYAHCMFFIAMQI